MSQTQAKRQFRRFEDDLRERLADPEYARVFLDVALEEYEQDGDTEAFLLALRDVAEAQGGLTQLAKRTKLNRQNLYKALSSKGNPRLQTVETILHGLGFRLSVEPAKVVETVKTSE
jgi:probable addiction module antidote protein